MQTYTHFLVGGALGCSLFPTSTLAQFSCACGGVVPDLVLLPKYVLDRIRGRQAFTEQSSWLLLIKELSHSIPFWGVLWLICWYFVAGAAPLVWKIGNAFLLGFLSHLIIDALTHCGEKFRSTDQGMLWPLKLKLGALVGLWEYRYDHGVLKPKLFELCVDICCFGFLLRYYTGPWTSH